MGTKLQMQTGVDTSHATLNSMSLRLWFIWINFEQLSKKKKKINFEQDLFHVADMATFKIIHYHSALLNLDFT